jgi:hypothetical protein
VSPDPDLERRVAVWAVEAEGEESARVRSRSRVLAERAVEEADITAIAGAAATSGRPVTMATAAGHRHRGRITGVGRDYLEVALETGQRRVLLRSAAVHVLEVAGSPLRPSDPALGGVAFTEPDLFLHAVERLVGTGSVVTAWPRSSGPQDGSVSGEPIALGQDFLCLRSGHGPDARTVYVPLDPLAELWLFMSG